MTLCVGAIASEQLNAQLEAAATAKGVKVQRDVRGRDTGTDGMAGVLASIDCAATSVGFPIRNMHTVSELGHNGDVLGCIEALHGWLEQAAADNLCVADLEVVSSLRSLLIVLDGYVSSFDRSLVITGPPATRLCDADGVPPPSGERGEGVMTDNDRCGAFLYYR